MVVRAKGQGSVASGRELSRSQDGRICESSVGESEDSEARRESHHVMCDALPKNHALYSAQISLTHST